VAKGAYVLADSPDPQVILIATGSEVSLALGAYEQLKSEGIAARVVSMPSWFRFERQDAAYRESVLPAKITARVAVEMAGGFGWDRYVGAKGRTVTMSGYGASAPAGKLMEAFGFTVGNVAQIAKEALQG